MLVDGLPRELLRVAAVLLLGGGLGAMVAGSVLARWPASSAALAAHEAKLARQLAFLRVRWRAVQVVRAQAALLLAALLFSVLESFLVASLALTVALSPSAVLSNRVLRRITRLEAQLDPWLYGLAGALRASPALGEAIAASTCLVQPPLRHELDLLLKEHRLGTSIEDALARMASRVGSSTVQSALASLRIGLRTGGQLPEIMERSAQALREMARLEGVVRTKTAEGKAQTFVVGVIPFPLMALVHSIDPGFFRPLWASQRGLALTGAAFVLWLLAIVLARRLVRVPI